MEEAAQTGAEHDQAADNASDPKEAQVLQNQAAPLSEVAEGYEDEVEGKVKVTGQ